MSDKLHVLLLNHLADRHRNLINEAGKNITLTTSDLKNAPQFMPDIDILATWGYMDIRPLCISAPKLKWVHALTAGIEGALFPELINSDILLTNSRGIYGITIAEHVLGMMLAFSRGFNLLLRQQLNKQWKRVPNEELYEKTVGIVGLGSIGREIAQKAKLFGMKVVATKRHPSAEPFVDNLYPAEQLDEMLAVCDYVIVALPLLPETKNLFTLERFKAMKQTAYFFNVARGSIVNENDLITALQHGMIKGAGLDVFMNEPLDAESPLWEMPNVIITPHTAALSPQYLDRTIKLFADNLANYVAGKKLLTLIDKKRGY